MLVWRGAAWPLRLDAVPPRRFHVPPEGEPAPVLSEMARRWVFTYGSNACPHRLVDRGLDRRGALLLPATAVGWAAAWEARRITPGGAVPLTLVPAPGRPLDRWVLGVHPDDLERLDAAESRGANYLLGVVGDVAVAARWSLSRALAYGPGPTTRVLAQDGTPVTHPARDQPAVRALLEAGAETVAAHPLPDAATSAWPTTPLEDLDLFVYGTLQPGEPGWPLIAGLVDVVGPGATRGQLVATPMGWPAATFAGEGVVHGMLLQPRGATAARELLRVTDRVEDAGRLFLRVAVRVELDGTWRWAAAYAWNRAGGAPPGQPVAEGRWRGARAQ